MTESIVPRSVLDNPMLGQWVSLGTPGRVTLSTGKVELGQGVLTALAQIAAEELELGLDRILLAPSDTAASPNEGFTAGSLSVEVSGASVRLAAAQLRMALMKSAGRRLGADPASLGCRDGVVLWNDNPTGLDFWSIAGEVDWKQPILADAPVRPRDAYRLVGTSVPRIDMPVKLAQGGFIHDLVLPGMLHGRVVRQPFRLAQLADVDEGHLRLRHPGVSVLRQEDFLALIGTDEFSVHRAQEGADTFTRWADIEGRWRPAATSKPEMTSIGAPEPLAIQGANRFTGEYGRGMVAHASIGPSCGLAQYQDGILTVWTHSQGIFALRDQIALCLGLATSKVRVIHAHGSGCYGHNGADDAALDAAIIAVHLQGRPVRVQWSRADELSRGPLGAAMSARIEASLDAANRIEGWSLVVRSAPHAQRPGAGGHVNLTSAEALDSGRLPDAVEDLPLAAGGGASRNSVAIYDFPSQSVTVEIDTRSRIRTSSLRSLGAHLNVFAIECAMDELAALAGADPLQFRMDHLTDERARNVLAEVGAMSGWATAGPKGDGRGRGLGLARYKGRAAYLAAVAEVEVEEEVRLRRLWLAVDAGLLINPEGARAQIEGGAIQSASWTLKEEVQVEDDRVPALGWSDYPILRFSEVPTIETRFIVDPNAPPLGTGEAAQGPVAAAIGNAVSRALGVRTRRLPLTRQRLVTAMMEL